MVKRLSKDNPVRQKRDLEVLALRLLGYSLREIGQEMGLAHSKVKAILDQEDIKPILDKYLKTINQIAEESFNRIIESYKKRFIEGYSY